LFFLEPLTKLELAVPGVPAVHVGIRALVAVGAVAVTVTVHGHHTSTRIAGEGVGGAGEELGVFAVAADVTRGRGEP
jgi:hypothetical protein